MLMTRERNMRKDWRQIRTAGGPRPQRSRKDEGVGDFPGVLARATRCDRGPVAVRYFALANSRATAGSWRGPFRFAHVLGHEPVWVVESVRSPAFRRPGPAKAGTPNRRSMESPLRRLRSAAL